MSQLEEQKTRDKTPASGGQGLRLGPELGEGDSATTKIFHLVNFGSCVVDHEPLL